MSSKYVVVDSNGLVIKQLVDSVHQIPDGAIKVTGEQWMAITQQTSGAWMLQSDGSFSHFVSPLIEADIAVLIASTRYAHEIAGIKIRGVSIDTGRESQALITGATLSAMLNSEYVCSWKTVDGMVKFTASELIENATAVRAHVQACFDREGELLAALAAKTYSPFMLKEGWPV